MLFIWRKEGRGNALVIKSFGVTLKQEKKKQILEEGEGKEENSGEEEHKRERKRREGIGGG